MKRIVEIIGVVWCTCFVLAADVYMTGNDVSPNSSLTNSINWSNLQVPSAGNAYYVPAGRTLRTPEGSGDYVFAGDKLVVSNNAIFAVKTSGKITIDKLYLAVLIQHWQAPAHLSLYGNLYALGSSSIGVGAASENDSRYISIYSQIYSANPFIVDFAPTNVTSIKMAGLYADNRATFTGRMRLLKTSRLCVTNESALGAAPGSFVANQLEFEGGAMLWLTNNLVLRDATRGIYLGSTQSIFFAQSRSGGWFEVAAGCTGSVACVMNGPGGLTKSGAGVLELLTNMTYVGSTVVTTGRLVASRATLATAQIDVQNGAIAQLGGTITTASVSVANSGTVAFDQAGFKAKSLVITNGVIDITLGAAVPDEPYIALSGTLIKAYTQPISVTLQTNAGVTEVAYPLLTVTNTAGIKAYDFQLNDPLMGELTMNEVNGKSILYFTPHLPENLRLMTSNNVINTSAYIHGYYWPDNLAPQPGYTYWVSNNTIRTPFNQGTNFLGRRLFFRRGEVAMKGLNMRSRIPNVYAHQSLTVSASEGGAGANAVSTNAFVASLLAVHYNGTQTTLSFSSGAMTRDIALDAVLQGYGYVVLNGTGFVQPEYPQMHFHVEQESPDFYGKIRVQGSSTAWLNVISERALGANPRLFVADQLSFNGAGIHVTNTLVFNDSNRGITLLAYGGVLARNNDGGAVPTAYTGSDTNYSGGVSIVVDPSATFTLNNAITGQGGLTKRGVGRLVLGGANSYTGETMVAAGTLEATRSDALGTGPLRTSLDGQLLCRTSSAMTNGVSVQRVQTPVFVRVEGSQPEGNFSVPLLTLPTSAEIDASAIVVSHAFSHYVATVVKTPIDASRIGYRAEFRFTGTILMVR